MNKAAHYPGKLPATPPASAPGPFHCGLARFVGLSVALALLAGCGGGRETVRTAPPPSTRDWPAVTPADPASANAVLMRAISLVGTPYRYGGNTPEGGFDCSGLVNYVFSDMLDVRLPRTSRALADYQGPKVPPRQLATADLVFFGSGGSVTHVGIYVGEGRFVHAPSTGGTVRLDHLDGHYWRDHYSGAKRILR
ncbi:C40 family peptidase [Lysobacter sp. 13A]|uniref:C40 family peptidase n=1 Tax=Novilysobacter selenitireducens TaxID=2872639 RepID=A0ABS7T948_9GAMM|nr:C40 family peptidase [Lysobacter selenitireducens]MBZ4040366.1 C40 family peptidase [Lysobacter selenitireducens]